MDPLYIPTVTFACVFLRSGAYYFDPQQTLDLKRSASAPEAQQGRQEVLNVEPRSRWLVNAGTLFKWFLK